METQGKDVREVEGGVCGWGCVGGGGGGGEGGGRTAAYVKKMVNP